MSQNKIDVIYIPGLAGRGRPLDQEVPLSPAKYNRYFYPYPQEPSYDLDDYDKAFLDFLDQHKIQRPLIIATSFGGILAMHFAAAYPERVKGIVMMSASIKFKLTRQLQLIIPFYHLLPIISPLQFFLRPLYRNSKKLINKWQGLGEDASEHFFTIPWRVYHKRLGILRRVKFTEEYQNIKVPFLFIFSKDDPVLPYEYVKEVSDKLARSQMKMVSAGKHFPHIADPVGVGKMMDEFAQKLE